MPEQQMQEWQTPIQETKWQTKETELASNYSTNMLRSQVFFATMRLHGLVEHFKALVVPATHQQCMQLSVP